MELKLFSGVVLFGCVETHFRCLNINGTSLKDSRDLLFWNEWKVSLIISCKWTFWSMRLLPSHIALRINFIVTLYVNIHSLWYSFIQASKFNPCFMVSFKLHGFMYILPFHAHFMVSFIFYGFILFSWFHSYFMVYSIFQGYILT